VFFALAKNVSNHEPNKTFFKPKAKHDTLVQKTWMYKYGSTKMYSLPPPHARHGLTHYLVFNQQAHQKAVVLVAPPPPLATN
jgi:hypothetical protein